LCGELLDELPPVYVEVVGVLLEEGGGFGEFDLTLEQDVEHLGVLILLIEHFVLPFLAELHARDYLGQLLLLHLG